MVTMDTTDILRAIILMGVAAVADVVNRRQQRAFKCEPINLFSDSNASGKLNCITQVQYITFFP